jgi:hypothetical protein
VSIQGLLVRPVHRISDRSGRVRGTARHRGRTGCERRRRTRSVTTVSETRRIASNDTYETHPALRRLRGISQMVGKLGQSDRDGMGHPRGDLWSQAGFQDRLQNRPDFAVQTWFQNQCKLGLEPRFQTKLDFGLQESAHDRAELESEGRLQEPANVAAQLPAQNAGQVKVQAAS